MANELEQQSPGTVLITGSAKRLGAAMALGLAEDGWNVVIHYRSSETKAHGVVDAVRATGRGAWCLEADLMDSDDCTALVPRAAKLAGGLDALICNASFFTTSTVFDATPQEFHNHMQMHAVAPTLLGRAFHALPRARHILNLLDSRITGPDEEHLAYHLSKRVLADLTRSMALAFAPRIAVNAIAPGAMLPGPGQDPSDFAALGETVPQRKTGAPGDIARAARYLLSTSFITGQVLYVDGGRHLQGKPHG